MSKNLPNLSAQASKTNSGTHTYSWSSHEGFKKKVTSEEAPSGQNKYHILSTGVFCGMLATDWL